MTALIRRGQVWTARVPFHEQDQGKDRPVVVLGWSPFTPSNDDHNIMVVPSFTFQNDPSKARSGDYAPRDWEDAGLGAGSFIRCRRLMTIAPQAFRFDKPMLGTLTPFDLDIVFTEVGRLFAVGAVAAVPGT